jgi:hypothetical protein
VLGIQWLKGLGPIVTDYAQLTMKFVHDSKFVELKVDAPSGPSDMSTEQLKRLLQTNGAASFFHLQVLPGPYDASAEFMEPPPHPCPEITALLCRYSSLFQSPSTLPPFRPSDHQIHLVPNSVPVNVRPYRYPQFQKSEIERQVEEMLKACQIQPSHSPFSSPILLVKNKDGSWRFCVDFRALNAITVKDRFPIPTIDELLDELGGAIWFSKLDLRQGYH